MTIHVPAVAFAQHVELGQSSGFIQYAKPGQLAHVSVNLD